ncbi:MAG: hypothetical protein L3J83_04850 [Proteobacteria bacterium]|nr:hypothetical protein [Pseudomonadota bacterium]
MESPYKLSDELTSDEIDDLREEIEAWQVSEMQAANQQATLHTSAGRSEDCVTLQVIVAVATCLVHGGMFEDPQEGIYHLFKAGTSIPDLSNLGI